MKLFALGRIDLAAARKLRLVGKVDKFTEMAIIMLRILSSVGDRVTPSGPPSALTSSTGGVVAGHRGFILALKLFATVMGVVVSSVDMAVFNGLRTDVVHC